MKNLILIGSLIVISALTSACSVKLTPKTGGGGGDQKPAAGGKTYVSECLPYGGMYSMKLYANKNGAGEKLNMVVYWNGTSCEANPGTSNVQDVVVTTDQY